MDMKEKLVELPIDDAILILREEHRQRADGYTTYLVNGGKGDPAEEVHIDALGMAISALEQTKWISVKKKCPRLRERKYYTVHSFDGTHEYTSSGFVVGLVENKPVIVEYCEEDVFAPWRDKAGYRSWFDENGKKQDVTHWMPLPQPPKGE